MPLVNGLETEKLMEVVDQVKQNWETGKTVWQASTKWKGGFRVLTCSREFTLSADEPDMLCVEPTLQPTRWRWFCRPMVPA